MEEQNAATLKMPDFLILGAQKCGTSSLYDYLARHPRIQRAANKEVHFFDLHYQEGLDWYRGRLNSGSGFRRPMSAQRRLLGEASPYYLFHPHVPRRVRDHAPSARFIVLLRHPVSRTYSHYNHAIRKGLETMPFEAALDQETARIAGEVEKMLQDEHYHSKAHQHHSYQARSRYAEQLRRWFDLFPRRQFLVIHSEDLHQDPVRHCQRILEFLDLPSLDLGRYPQSNNGGKYAPMRASTYDRLSAYFAPYNRDLADLLGHNRF